MDRSAALVLASVVVIIIAMAVSAVKIVKSIERSVEEYRKTMVEEYVEEKTVEIGEMQEDGRKIDMDCIVRSSDERSEMYCHAENVRRGIVHLHFSATEYFPKNVEIICDGKIDSWLWQGGPEAEDVNVGDCNKLEVYVLSRSYEEPENFRNSVELWEGRVMGTDSVYGELVAVFDVVVEPGVERNVEGRVKFRHGILGPADVSAWVTFTGRAETGDILICAEVETEGERRDLCRALSITGEDGVFMPVGVVYLEDGDVLRALYIEGKTRGREDLGTTELPIQIRIERI